MPKVLLFTLILAILALGYFYFKNNTNTGLDKATAFSVKIVSEKEKDQAIKISAEYPQFEKVPQDFNNKIKSLVDLKIAEFKKSSNENRQNRPESKEQWPFTMTWTPSQLNSKYVSFVLQTEYFNGGANMFEDIDTFNYDLSNNKDVKLIDLFASSDYLNRISKYSIKYLTDKFKETCNGDLQCIPTEMINEGAASKEENFSRFTFTDDTITFYFPKGTVAPGYAGEQTIIMPRNLGGDK